ncbi:Uncharacterised protein [Serratia marcescens]|uniref:hypothetical protein n=1 Tax=Serratia marcescens TaxID=615 RepID=UPI0007450B84|nr:hypothetical protein [Serratia marcescens]CVG57909.1 Uncharacterised protein [Serratia marcescens]
MAKRGDNSAFLYHWIKSNINSNASLEEKYEDAFETLLLILSDYALKSGKSLGHKFGHGCICFTGTPVWFIQEDKSKYQPFGFEFYKNDIYKIGGEHVIYCSEESAKRLSQEDVWKWMRHEPLVRTVQTPYGTDFSWEREVRVNASKINFLGPSEIVEASSPSEVRFAFTHIYVPSILWKQRLLSELRGLLDKKLKEDERDPGYCYYEEFYNSMMLAYKYAIEVVP